MNLSKRREVRKFVLDFGEGDEVYHIAYLTQADQDEINRLERSVKENVGQELGEDFLIENDKMLERVFYRCLVDWDVEHGPKGKEKRAPCNDKFKKEFFEKVPARALKIVLMARNIMNYIDHENIEKN